MAISIGSVVWDVFARYDHNRDGTIDLESPDGFWDALKNPDERKRSVTRSTYTSGRASTYTTTRSRDRLFIAADRDGDRKATPAEVEQVVRSFDRDGDGMLPSRGFWGWLFGKPRQEYDLFDDEYGER